MNSSLNFKTIIAELSDASEPPPLIAIACKEKTRWERVRETIFQSVKSPQIIKTDCSNFSFNDWIDLEAEINALSLFSNNRIFILTNANKLDSKTNKRLTETIEKIPPATHLVAIADSFPKNNDLRKYATQKCTFIELSPLKNVELRNWTKHEFARQGLTKVSANVIEHVVHLGEESPDKIASLIDQCSLFVTGHSFTEREFHKLFGDKIDLKDFALIDAIQSGNLAQSELLAAQLVRQGRSPFILLSMIARSYNQIAKLHSLKIANTPEADCLSMLGLPEWLFKKVSKVSVKFSPRTIQKCLSAISSADLRLKDKSLGDEAILSQLIGDLCQASMR